MLFLYQLLIYGVKVAARVQYWRCRRTANKLVAMEKGLENIVKMDVSKYSPLTQSIHRASEHQLAMQIPIVQEKQFRQESRAESLENLAEWLANCKGRLIPGFISTITTLAALYFIWKHKPELLIEAVQWLASQGL